MRPSVTFWPQKWIKSKRLVRPEGTYSTFEQNLRWSNLIIDLSLRQTASMWFSNDRSQWKYELSALCQAICIDFPWKIAEIVILSWEGHFLLSQLTFKTAQRIPREKLLLRKLLSCSWEVIFLMKSVDYSFRHHVPTFDSRSWIFLLKRLYDLITKRVFRLRSIVSTLCEGTEKKIPEKWLGSHGSTQ